MANVPAIQDFNGALNVALNALISIRSIRDDLAATDRLWPSLNTVSKNNIKAQLQADLDTAKAAIASLLVP